MTTTFYPIIEWTGTLPLMEDSDPPVAALFSAPLEILANQDRYLYNKIGSEFAIYTSGEGLLVDSTFAAYGYYSIVFAQPVIAGHVVTVTASYLAGTVETVGVYETTVNLWWAIDGGAKTKIAGATAVVSGKKKPVVLTGHIVVAAPGELTLFASVTNDAPVSPFTPAVLSSPENTHVHVRTI